MTAWDRGMCSCVSTGIVRPATFYCRVRPNGVAGVQGDTMDIMQSLGHGLEKGRGLVVHTVNGILVRKGYYSVICLSELR